MTLRQYNNTAKGTDVKSVRAFLQPCPPCAKLAASDPECQTVSFEAKNARNSPVHGTDLPPMRGAAMGENAPHAAA